MINNNVWTQTQTYAPVNTFNINGNTRTGPSETLSAPGENNGPHTDVNVQGAVFVVDQHANFGDQTMVNPTEIKNVEITKDITKTVDIDKTIIKDSNNS